MDPLTIIIIAVSAAFTVFYLAPALLIFFAVFGRKKAVPFEEYNLKRFKNHYYIPYLGRIAEARDRLKARPHMEVEVLSYDGLTLRGDYYDRGAKKTAVLFHGIGAEMYTNLSAHARFLYKSGFNVLLACHRAHGRSGGRWTTIGLRERYDVLSWADRAKELGAEEILLYGVSMGGASVAFASDRLDPAAVKAVVVDSGFYSVHEQMKRDAHKNHIPGMMIPAQRFLAKLFLRVDIRDNTADTLAKSRVPVLFLHGSADETVEHRWARVNCDACSEPKKLVLIEGAPHTLSILKDPQKTEKELSVFIETYFN